MSNKVIPMQQIRMLLQLLERGHSLREISAKMELSRQTVTSYAVRINASGLDFATLRGFSDAALAAIVYLPAEQSEQTNSARRLDFTDRFSYLQSELKRTGVTRLLLWEEYAKEYPAPYRYTQFCTLLKDAARPGTATMMLQHQAGHMMMVDFAGDKLSYVDRQTGELFFVPVLVVVLPYSKYSFATPLKDATIPQLIRGLNECLAYFGGVPACLKTDNMKQIVTQSCRYEPVFGEVMQQWALHVNLTLMATRVRKPKDKAAVENEVKIAYQRIYAPLRDQVSHSLEELKVAVEKQVLLHNNKLFQLKDHSRRDLFERDEQPLLQLLPPEPFTLKHQAVATVQKNYHITLGENQHHYSVPFRFIGKKVRAVYDTDTVEVYYQHERIALHTRSYKKYGITTSGDHMPPGHQQYAAQGGWTPDYFLGQALGIGEATQAYMDKVLKDRAFTEQTYNACRGILRLEKVYGAARLEIACRRALQGAVFNYRTIQNILLHKLDGLEPHPPGSPFQLPEHTNLRGGDAYQ